MSIEKVIASVQKLHGDTRNQAALYTNFIAWQARRRWVAPDYSKPGVAEQVRASVDEAYDAHYSIDKTRG